MRHTTLNQIAKVVALSLITALPATSYATTSSLPIVEDLRAILNHMDGNNERGGAKNNRGNMTKRATYNGVFNNHWAPDGPGDQKKLGNLNKDGTMDNEKTLKQGPSGTRGKGIGETNSR